MNTANGKGSRRRPQQISDAELEQRWYEAFKEDDSQDIVVWSDGCGEVYTEEAHEAE